MKKCLLGNYVSDQDMSMVLMTRINKVNTMKAQGLEEENGQKETPENVNEGEEASIDFKKIAERAVEIVNLKSEREKSKEKAEKDFPYSVKLFKKPGHIDAIMTWKFRLNLMLMASMMSMLNMHK